MLWCVIHIEDGKDNISNAAYYMYNVLETGETFVGRKSLSYIGHPDILLQHKHQEIMVNEWKDNLCSTEK